LHDNVKSSQSLKRDISPISDVIIYETACTDGWDKLAQDCFDSIQATGIATVEQSKTLAADCIRKWNSHLESGLPIIAPVLACTSSRPVNHEPPLTGSQTSTRDTTMDDYQKWFLAEGKAEAKSKLVLLGLEDSSVTVVNSVAETLWRKRTTSKVAVPANTGDLPPSTSQVRSQ
jgi:hypothetical protein